MSKRYLSRKKKIGKDKVTIPWMRLWLIKTLCLKMLTLGIGGSIRSINRTTACLLKSNSHSKSSKYNRKYKQRSRSRKESHSGTRMSCLTDLIQSMRCWMKTWTSCLISRHLMVDKILKSKAFNQKCCQTKINTFKENKKMNKWRWHKWARRTRIWDFIVDTKESQACKMRKHSILMMIEPSRFTRRHRVLL